MKACRSTRRRERKDTEIAMTHRPLHHLLAATIALAIAAPGAHAASFVYEGRLDDLGQPANGRYDLKLSAYGDPEQGVTLAAPLTFEGVEVRDGQFRLDVDLPLVKADRVWLEVSVRGSGEPVFSKIPGRSKAIAAPLIGACWSTTGDSGSTAANFIGTTDDRSFTIRTNNTAALRLAPRSIGGTPVTANVLAGASFNQASAGVLLAEVRGATISGGGAPTDSDPDVAGEGPNRVTDHYGSIGGGAANRAGNNNNDAVDASFATVGGGRGNIASGSTSVVGGGSGNAASATASTVGGGRLNQASNADSTVAGGYENTASGESSTVGGGDSNVASGIQATVVGGYGNTASGVSSTVGGGEFNCAGGSYSWAGGRRAKVLRGSASGASGEGCIGVPSLGTDGDQGTFIWADSQDADFFSTASNRFLVRAMNGVWFGTGGTASIPSDRFINTSTGAYLTTGGAWTNASSRSLKSDFIPVDAVDVLGRVLRLGISTWAYRESSEGRHMGPIAEDFHALFGLGGDEGSISTVDASGVALAAIQGLDAKLEAERDALAARVELLDAENAGLRTRLERLEALLGLADTQR